MSKTIQEIVEFTDKIKPNGFTKEQKALWLSDVEGQIQLEVLLMAPAEVVSYTWEADRDTRVLVDPPYDKLYTLYLQAQIDFENGEYAKYQNTAAAFSAAMNDFIVFITHRYEPANGYRDEEYSLCRIYNESKGEAV